jgi:hypothetical protein
MEAAPLWKIHLPRHFTLPRYLSKNIPAVEEKNGQESIFVLIRMNNMLPPVQKKEE